LNNDPVNNREGEDKQLSEEEYVAKSKETIGILLKTMDIEKD